jgi:hypothetical protein
MVTLSKVGLWSEPAAKPTWEIRHPSGPDSSISAIASGQIIGKHSLSIRSSESVLCFRELQGRADVEEDISDFVSNVNSDLTAARTWAWLDAARLAETSQRILCVRR